MLPNPFPYAVCDVQARSVFLLNDTFETSVSMVLPNPEVIRSICCLPNTDSTSSAGKQTRFWVMRACSIRGEAGVKQKWTPDLWKMFRKYKYSRNTSGSSYDKLLLGYYAELEGKL